jgi:glutamine amidotransferase
MIHVIDYGAGNLGSILNMIKRIGGHATLVSRSRDLVNATKIILPGVGHFDYGMRQLNKSGMVDLLHEKVLYEKVPILGICLGAQMMCKGSEEGSLAGLSWFDAEVNKFNFENSENLRVPHMGWSYVKQMKKSDLSEDLPEDSRFYFVHSYHMVANEERDILFKTNYGYDFASGLQNENRFACQFHPEKSHKYGIKMFKNFAAI